MNLDDLTLKKIKELQGLLSSNETQKNEFDKNQYVIVRTYSSGVFACYLDYVRNTGHGFYEVRMRNVRRIWSWEGAASLSQLAEQGTSKPDECRFSVEVKTERVPNAIEILDVSETAAESIKKVPVWKK